MINSFSFIVPGPPVGKERPRKGKHGFYTPKRTHDYEKLVQTYALEAQLLKKKADGESWHWNFWAFYKVIIKIYYEGKGGRLPDIDNIIKSILDGMNKVAYMDDNCVRKIEAAIIQNAPATEVHVEVSYET